MRPTEAPEIVDNQKKQWRSGLQRPLVVLATCAVVTGGLLYFMGPRVPHHLAREIKAGMAARDVQDPDLRIQKYLEARYGDLREPANREKAFLDFFNVHHVQALQWLVQHTPEQQRQANIEAMARWVEKYRNSLTVEERAELRTRIQTAEGKEMLQRATAQYNSQDVAYRGDTAVVISQLLRTISTVQSE